MTVRVHIDRVVIDGPVGGPLDVDRAQLEAALTSALTARLDQTAPETRGIKPAVLVGFGGAAAPVRRVASNNAPRPEIKPAPVPTVEIIRGDKRAQEVVTQE